MLLTYYYTACNANKRGDADEEGEEEERDDGEQSAGGHNLNDHIHNNDDDDEEEEEEEEEEVLADVYLAKTVCKWPLVDTQITHPSTDHRAEPSIVAEDIKIPYFKSLIHKFLQHHPHWQLNLWILKATSASTCPLWLSTVLPVTFVESMAWLGNTSTQHHNGANSHTSL